MDLSRPKSISLTIIVKIAGIAREKIAENRKFFTSFSFA
jgi:hypothetical protein